jgi:molecular chaperone GrpE
MPTQPADASVPANPETGAPTPTAAADPSALAAPGPDTHPAMPMPTPEEAAELRAKAHQADENWTRYLRAMADLENFKKRAARERQEAEKYRHEALLRDLLPVLDNLEMAFAAAQDSSLASLAALEAGVTMIRQQLRTVLTGAGLEEIDATGQAFDPRLHEAVAQQESTEVPDGRVLQQVRRGFKYRDRLLRPASVVVAQHKSKA